MYIICIVTVTFNMKYDAKINVTSFSFKCNISLHQHVTNYFQDHQNEAFA